MFSCYSIEIVDLYVLDVYLTPGGQTTLSLALFKWLTFKNSLVRISKLDTRWLFCPINLV